MKPHRSALALTFAMTTSIPALAATNFTDGDPTDSLVSNPLNWDNGLPTGGANPGTLGLNAKANSTVLDGFDITHADGTLNNTVSGIDILGEGATVVLTWEQAQADLGDGSYFVFNASANTLSLGSGAPPVSNPFQITAFSAVAGEPGVWQVSLTGDPSTAYVFRSTANLDFSSGSLVENLTPGVPAAGTTGGTNDSVVTTDGSGVATVRMTLPGNPTDFVRAETAP